ncbi:MAG: DUF1365 domain-containing protein [Campylobacterales bacterium]|nr:DUF1365 domain-containing protein [Campylobacterales bacterium]
MSHRFFEGEVFHKRFTPKEHKFLYPFFLLDIDLQSFDTLKNSLFSRESFNLFSFSGRDHFGASQNFLQNVEELLKHFELAKTKNIRFLTLPKVFGYVFNPISVLLLFNDLDELEYMLVEVHNYNGGRIVYKVKMEKTTEGKYSGNVEKDMYVSPFLKRDGVYKFTVSMNDAMIAFNITLIEDGDKKLIASFRGEQKEFSAKNVLKLFCKHTFLTLWVVTRTLWQSAKLRFKGIKFNSVTAQDQVRRY